MAFNHFQKKMPHHKKSKRNLSETDELDSNQLDQDENMDENQLKPVKKHKCPFCDKRFTQPNSVSRHVSGVHEGEKPFVCEICGASFSQNKNLAVHIAAKHEGKRPFQCDLCGVRYREKRCLQRHKRRMHFDKNTLDECLINKIPSIPVTRTDLNDQKKCKQKDKPVNNPSMHREHKRPSAAKNKVPLELKAKSPKLDLKPHSSVPEDRKVPKSPSKKSEKKSLEDIKELHDHEDFFLERQEDSKESEKGFQDPKEDFQNPLEDFQEPNQDFHEDFQRHYEEPCMDFKKELESLPDINYVLDDTKIEISENPWLVDSINSFYFLKCPECNFDSKWEDTFQDHALENHPKSFVLFGKSTKEIDFENDDVIETDERHLEDPRIEDTKDFNFLDEYSNSKCEKKKLFKCSYCDANLSCNSKLKRHITNVHEKNIVILNGEISSYKCSLCEYNSGKKSDVIKHNIKIHEVKKLHQEDFNCLLCNIKYSSIQCLNTHTRAVHEGKREECSHCDRSYSSKHDLKKHFERVHEGKIKDKKHQCSECGKVYLERRALKKHVKSVHEGDNSRTKKSVNNLSKCSLCEEKFTKKKDLLLHISSTHEGMKPNLCTLCGKSFTTKNNMIVHIKRVHEGKKKNYSCNLCDSSFYKKCELERHFKFYHDVKCKFCESKFDSNIKLNNHIKTVHEEKKGYFCVICAKRFELKGNMNKHFRVTHKNKSSIKVEDNR